MVINSMHYLVSGTVQKVGFRAFVHKQALKLELKGWVRNLADGRVEVLARGSEESLSLFEALLGQGPVKAEVIKVTKAPVEWDTPSSQFVVQPDGDQVWPNS